MEIDNRERKILPLTLMMSQDAYVNDINTPIGRRSAGSSFLDAYLQFSGNVQHSIVAQDLATVEWFQGRAQAMDPESSTNHIFLRNWGIEAKKTGTFHIPDPHLERWAWRRMIYGDGYISLLGIMHTLSGNSIQKALSEFSTSPIRPWDALICTSQAGKKVVEGFLERQEAYLKWRHKAIRFERPQLPIIPLAIDPTQWTTQESPKTRKKRCRLDFGLSNNAKIVLIAGRLDYFTKFQPDPLLRVLQKLRSTSQPDLELIIYGEALDDKQLADWKKGALQLAPSLPIHWFPGKNCNVSAPLRWASDVFVSLADNPQETFGITPLEAMASGLPCLVSDWDGYRDTVVQTGEGAEPTGIRIPTRIVEGLGTAESIACANGVMGDRPAIGLISQGIAVDQDELENGLNKLLDDEPLREVLGQAGVRRVNRLYNWKVVIEQWRELVQNLTDIRERAQQAGLTLRPQLPPCRPSISTAFGCYATEILNKNWNPPTPPEDIEADRLNNPFQEWDQSLLKYSTESPRRRGWWLKQGLVKP